jgi:hypothetical protein
VIMMNRLRQRRTSGRRRQLVGILAVVATAVVILRAAPAGTVSLAVKGRSNETPSVAAAGSFVAVAWSASGAGKSDVFVAVSGDGGRSFGVPVQVNTVQGEARVGGELPPRVAVVSRSKGTDPEIAVAWTARSEAATEVKVSRSRNRGRTFDPPTTLQSTAAAGDRGWPALALDDDGVAHAIWLDHRAMAAARASGAAGAGHQPGTVHDSVAMAQRSSLFYAAASGRAPTEREVTKGVCYCCKTALAVGARGELYAAWRHVYPGNFRDIAFTVSRDRGQTFAPLVRVSEDEWAINACPDDGPAIGVDEHGTVHIAWRTVIGGANPEGALFYASTRDGRTFTPRIRIPTLGSVNPTHPQLVVDRAGRIVVAWDEAVEGRRVAAARELIVNPAPKVDFAPVVTLSADEAATYPALAATDRGLLAAWTNGGGTSVIQTRIIQLQ